MERRLFRLAWAAAIIWAIAGVYYCMQLNEQYTITRKQASWGSVAEKQLKADCEAHVHTSAIDCYLNAQESQSSETAENDLVPLADKINASGKWTFWPPFGFVGAFFLVRWLVTGRWRAEPKR